MILIFDSFFKTIFYRIDFVSVCMLISYDDKVDEGKSAVTFKFHFCFKFFFCVYINYTIIIYHSKTDMCTVWMMVECLFVVWNENGFMCWIVISLWKIEKNAVIHSQSTIILSIDDDDYDRMAKVNFLCSLSDTYFFWKMKSKKNWIDLNWWRFKEKKNREENIKTNNEKYLDIFCQV